MEAFELFREDGRGMGVFACGKCSIVHRGKDNADRCCEPMKCERCGSLGVPKHYTVCDPCRSAREIEREAARFQKAEKVTEWDGWIYTDAVSGHRDGFFSDVGELQEYIEEETPDAEELEDLTLEEIADLPKMPAYVWTCDPNRFAVLSIADIKDLIYNRETYEDFDSDDLNGCDALESALNAFNAANANVLSWTPNMARALVLNS